MIRRLQIATFTALLLAAAPGCGKAEPTTPAPAAPEVAPVKVAPVVQAYDDLREALALDDLPKAKTAATKLATAASGEYAKIAEQATVAVSSANLDAMRVAFGEVSRALLGAFKDKPALAEGLFVYRCPMVESYQKWVQVSKTMRNPYMGQRMLECGSKAKPEP